MSLAAGSTVTQGVSACAVVVVVGSLLAALRLWRSLERSRLREQRARLELAVCAGDLQAADRSRASERSRDGLTGLPDRQALLDHLGAGQHPGGTLIIVDIDGFRAVNQRLGSAAGDEVLRAAARVLRASVEAEDDVARLGDDEFAVLLRGGPDDSGSWERIVGALHRVTLPVGGFSFSMSAGGTRTGEGSSADVLMTEADIALREAQAAGGGHLQIFSRDRLSTQDARRSLQADLAAAVDNGQLRVAYQPVVNLTNGTLTGFEALLRWNHPVLGTISPETFIPLAEESGLMNELGDWVLREALRQLRRWHLAGQPELGMAVNLSTSQLTHDTLVDRVRKAVTGSGVDPRCVTLELTESLVMESSEEVQHRLLQLRSLGLRLALDDFGSGHSSLGRLSALPIDTVKIDRSFISPLVHGRPAARRHALLLQAAVAMCHGLDLNVIAEGAETSEQVAFLRALGCQEVQGFHLSRPTFAQALDVPALAWSLPAGDWSFTDAPADSRPPGLMPSLTVIPVPRVSSDAGVLT